MDDKDEAEGERFARWSSHFDASVECVVAGHKLLLSQKPSSDDVGHSVWDVSRAIAKYFELGFLRSEFRRHARVIELGAGCGLLGMAAAIHGGRVFLTDLPDIIPILQENVEANSSKICKISGGSVHVQQLRWGVLEDAEALKPPFDVILGTDVVYYPELVQPLVDTLVHLSNHDTQIIIVNERRSPRVHEMFFKTATEHFKYQRLNLNDIAPFFEINVFEAFSFRKRRKAN